MEKEVGQSGVEGGPLLHPLGHIGRDHGRKPVTAAQVGEGGFRNDGLAIDKKNPGSLSSLWVGAQENRAEKGAVTGT
jgi:hypothetical protein